MSWLRETHGTKLELVRLFLGSLFESDFGGGRGQWCTVAIGVFAMLVPARLLMFQQTHLVNKPDAVPEATELAMMTLSIAVVGLLALVEWRFLLPTQRDCLVLAGMPVLPRQIFFARFTSVFLLAAGAAIAVNAVSVVLEPCRLAHAISGGLACLFVFYAIVALQGLLMNSLPVRWFIRLAPYVQAALVCALFLSALGSWWIADWQHDELAHLRDFAWMPSVWFLGLHEYLAGSRDPFVSTMSTRAAVAVGAAMITTLFVYLLCYRRYKALLLEALVHVPVRHEKRWSLIALISRDPRQQAIVHFMSATLTRSSTHRTVLLAYMGGALGILINSSLVAWASWAVHPGLANWHSALRFAVLFWPLGSSAILLAGLRHVFSIPAELPANWAFQLTESLGRMQWMAAVERFVLVFAILPLYAVLTPLAVAALGGLVAVRMAAVELLATLVMFELLFWDWQRLPFTCTYVPGKRPLVGIVSAWLILLGFVLPVIARIIVTLSEMWETFLIGLVPFAALWLWARKFRRDGWGEARLLYEDRVEIVPSLGINELTFGGVRTLATEPPRKPEDHLCSATMWAEYERRRR